MLDKHCAPLLLAFLLADIDDSRFFNFHLLGLLHFWLFTWAAIAYEEWLLYSCCLLYILSLLEKLYDYRGISGDCLVYDLTYRDFSLKSVI